MSDRGFASLFMIFVWFFVMAMNASEGHVPDWVRIVIGACASVAFVVVLRIKLERNRRTW